jgi:hypothetical protein
MFRELRHMLGTGAGEPIAILMLASMLRDDAPWLYELGLEAYRAAKSGRRDQARAAMKRFKRAAENHFHGSSLLQVGSLTVQSGRSTDA